MSQSHRPPVVDPWYLRVVDFVTRRVGLVVFALVLTLVAVASTRAYGDRDTARTQRNAAYAGRASAEATATRGIVAAHAVATDVTTLCRELAQLHRACPVPDPAQKIAAIVGTATPSVSSGGAVTPAQDAVDVAVRVYFAAHPPKVPAAVIAPQLVRFATAYLRDHTVLITPSSGASPTAIELAPPADQVETIVAARLPIAVADYFATHPVPTAIGPSGLAGPSGQVGPSGQDGSAPTAEQIEAALSRYFIDHPPPLCPPSAPATTIVLRQANGGNATVLSCVAATEAPPSSDPPPSTDAPTDIPSPTVTGSP